MTYYRITDYAGDPISDLNSLSFSAGKRNLLDVVSASTGSFTFRRTSGNSTQLDAAVPGDAVTLEYSNNGSTWFTLAEQNVTDVSVRWGNPSPGPVYNDDYVVITTEGYLGRWGRVNLDFDVAGGTAAEQLLTINGVTQLGYTQNISTYSSATLYPYTVRGSAQDYLQLLATTMNCRYNDYNLVNNVQILSGYNFPTSTYNFTDQAASGTLLSYQDAEFTSLAINYFNQVFLSIGDLGWPATALDPAAVQPYRILQLPTIWGTALEATGFAEYLLDLYKSPSQQLASVTCLSEAQGNSRLAQIAVNCIGTKFSAAFRGTTLYGICEGFELVANPGSSTFTFYFSTANQDIGWLILDSSTQGKLDTNKIAF